jgi:hypothetical protein
LNVGNTLALTDREPRVGVLGDRTTEALIAGEDSKSNDKQETPSKVLRF